MLFEAFYSSLSDRHWLLQLLDANLLGGQKLALRAIAGALRPCTSKLLPSPDDCSLTLGVDNRATRALFETLNQYLMLLIDQRKDAIVVAGCIADAELGENSFRCVGREHGIVWVDVFFAQ